MRIGDDMNRSIKPTHVEEVLEANGAINQESPKENCMNIKINGEY